MKVQNIQSQNFESKKKFITNKTKEGIEFLLKRMNAETQYINNSNTFKSTVLMGLKYKNKADFIDARTLLSPVSSDKQMILSSVIKIGGKEYTIDNSTGEIIRGKKGFFSTWKNVINKIEKYVLLFKENYFDESKITKKYLNIQSLTEQGFAKLQGKI